MPHLNQQTPGLRLNLTLSLVFLFTLQLSLAQNSAIPLKRGHQGWLSAFALSSSNKYLVTAGSDNQLIIWDYASGKQVREINIPVAVTALEISADDRYLYSADTSSRVTKWDIGTGKKILDFLAHGAKEQEYEEDEGMLVAIEIDDEQMEKILDERYRRTRIPRYNLSNDIHLTLSSNGQLLISGGKDGKINIWDTNTGKLARNFFDQDVPIAALCLSKDMKYLLSQGVDNQATLWDFTKGKVIKSFHAEATLSGNFSKDGIHFSYLLASDTLQVINLINGKVESTIPLERWLIGFIHTTNEALIVGTGSNDTTYYMDAKTGKVTLKNNDLDGSNFATKDLKGRVVYMNKNNKKINIYDPQLKTQVTQFGVFVPDIQSIKFSKNGEHLLVNDAGRYVHDIDLRNPKQPNFFSYPLPYYWYQNLADLSPDGKKLAIASANGDLTVWNTDNKTKQKNRIDFTSTPGFSHGWTRVSPAITGLCFSPDGQQVILADYTYGLYFFDVRNLSKQYFYSHFLQDENNLIKLPKDSSFLLINEMGKGYGGIYQLDLQSISKEKIDSGKLVKKFQVDYINERLIDFDVSNGNKFLAYQTELGQAGIVEVGTNQQLLNVSNCVLAKWVGANKKYGLFVHQQKVTIWDVENQRTSIQYNLPYIPLHAALHPSENLLLLVHPNQSFEIRSVIDGKLIGSWFWQAGTNNFQFLSPTGQKTEEIWKTLQAQFQSKGSEIEKLLANAPNSNKDLRSDLPNDFEKYILNIGHSSSIKHLSIHADGKYLWTIDATGLGKIWDLKMGRELRTVSHPMMSNDLIYAPGATPHVLKFSTEGSPRSWELDLSTGMVTENATIINKGFVFDNSGNQRIAPWYSGGISLKFTLPNGVQIAKTFKQKFTPNRGVYNPEKKIVSIYGYHEYDENFLISYHGANFKDSTILPLDLGYRDRQIDNIWVYPGTDSILLKTGEGNTFLFHPLSKSLQRSTFIDAEKISNLIFSPDKQFFARALLEQGVVEVRRTSNKALLLRRSLPGFKISGMSFTPSSKNLVLTDGGKIWNWDIQQDTILQFSDFFVKNEENQSYESAGYCHLLSSGKLIFITTDLNHENNYKTIDLITGRTEIFELSNTFDDLHQSHDNLYVENQMGSITSVFDQKVIPFPSNISGISDVAFSNKSKHIGIIHEAQSTFTYWNVELQKIAFTRKLQEVYYKAEISSSDSLIALSSKKMVLLLNARTGKELKRIPVETDGSSRIRLKFSPDHRYLYINCPHEGIVILWDLLIGKEFKRFSFKYDSGYLIGVSSNNQTFFGAVDGAVFAYNQEGKELYRVQLKERDIKIEYFPNDQKIIVASNKGIIYQIDALTGTILQTIYLGNYQNWIAVDQNNQIYTSTGAEKYVHYRTKQGTIGLSSGKSRIIPGSIPSLLQPKNNQIPTSSNEGKVSQNPFALVNDKWKTNLAENSLKNIDFQGPRANSPYFISQITQVKFTNDDETIVAQEALGSIHFIERVGFRLLKSLKTENPSQVPFVLSKDDRFLICLDGKQTIHLYQLSNGELLQKRTITNSAISALTISPNGQFLLVGTLDGQIYTCKLPDLSVIHSFYASEARVVQIKMNNESDKVIIANANSDFVSFELSPGHQLVNPVFLGNLSSYGPVSQLEFTSNQKVMVFTRDLVYSLTAGISGSFQKVFTYPKEGAAVLLDPSNLNQFYYQNERSYPTKWYLYNINEKKQIDSIPNSGIFLAVSRDKKLAITNSGFTSHYLYPFDMLSQKDVPIENTPGILKGFKMDSQDVYYIQGGYEGRAYQIDLLTSNTSTLPGTYDTGNFLLEKGNWNFTGGFLKQPQGIGKKSLRDTSFIWKLSGNLETIATSDNGQYLVHSAYQKDTVYVYSSLSQKLVYKLHIPKNDNLYFYISNDGKFLVVKKYHGSAEASVFDLTTQKLLFTDQNALGVPSFSSDTKYLFLPGIQTIRVYDLTNRSLAKEHTRTLSLLSPMFQLPNPKFGIIASSTEYYQLWDLSKGLLLGRFKFFTLKNNPPAWTFATPDGRFDGSPDGLKQLYYIEENRLRSKELDLKNDPKYQPGLLSKILK